MCSYQTSSDIGYAQHTDLELEERMQIATTLTQAVASAQELGNNAATVLYTSYQLSERTSDQSFFSSAEAYQQAELAGSHTPAASTGDSLLPDLMSDAYLPKPVTLL